ncbi:hypothetical protein ABH912_001337 [Pseudomonas sp. BT76 TE3572]
MDSTKYFQVDVNLKILTVSPLYPLGRGLG